MRCDQVCLGHADSHGKGATTRRRRSWGAGRTSRTRAEGALETGCRSGAPRLRTKSSQAGGVLTEGVRRHRGLGVTTRAERCGVRRGASTCKDGGAGRRDERSPVLAGEGRRCENRSPQGPVIGVLEGP